MSALRSATTVPSAPAMAIETSEPTPSLPRNVSISASAAAASTGMDRSASASAESAARAVRAAGTVGIRIACRVSTPGTTSVRSPATYPMPSATVAIADTATVTMRRDAATALRCR